MASPTSRFRVLIRRYRTALIGLLLGAIILFFAQSLTTTDEFTFEQSSSAIVKERATAIDLKDDRGSQLLIPKDAPLDRPIPLLINLHGYTGTGASQSRYTFLDEAAVEAGIAYIAPTGSEDNQGRTFWNSNAACCNFNNSDVDDVAFIDSLIEKFSTVANIDRTRIYLFGHSNGSFMAYGYLCSGSKKVAAIAGLAGAMNTDPARCKSRPNNVLHIHGEQDETILYNGGSLFGALYTSAQATLDQWSAINGCSQRQDSDLDLLESPTGIDTVKVNYRCSKGALELWRMPMGKHTPVLDLGFARNILDWLMGFTSSTL
jgi:polyhydroxybutyrate depolymerase